MSETPYIRTSNELLFDTEFGDIDWYQAYSTCNGSVLGTVQIDNQVGRPGATALDNCVGFANGAFNETFWRNMRLTEKGKNIPKKQYFQFTCNANQIMDSRVHSGFTIHPAVYEGWVSQKDFKKCYIPANGVPKEGSIVCWGGSSTCHTAYVKEVINNDTIRILQSGYNMPAWTSSIYDSSGKLIGYGCNDRLVHRHCTKNGKTWKNIWWYNNDGRNLWDDSYCQGFFSNPALGIPKLSPPVIESITQDSPVKVTIKGRRGPDDTPTQFCRIYYKWGYDVSEKDYDADYETFDLNFELSITKPREATHIAVLLLSIVDGDVYSRSQVSTQSLSESFPSMLIKIEKDGELVNKNVVPHIYTGEKWVRAIPTFREDSKNWYYIYNDSKEKVK